MSTGVYVKPTEVRFTTGAKTLQAFFSEKITNTGSKTYNCTNWRNVAEETVRCLLQNLFSHKHVRTITVEHRRLIIRHNGAPRASLEARVLKGMRDSGMNPEEK